MNNIDKKRRTKTGRSNSSAGSLRLRDNGIWEGRVVVRYDPDTGKPIRKSVYASTKSEAREKLVKLTNDVNEGSYVHIRKGTVNQWLDKWIDELCADKKDLSMQKYRGTINKNIRPHIGEKQLNQLKTIDIQRLYNHLSDPDKGHGLAPKTVKDIHSILRRSFEVAIDMGYMKENPCNGTVLPRRSKPEIQPLSNDQFRKFLELTDEDRIYGTYYQVALLTGMRKSEALGLCWDKVDFDRGIIVISRQLQQLTEENGGYVMTDLKNTRARAIKPAPYIMNLLKKRYQEQEADALAAGSSWMAWTDEESHRTAFVFTNELGDHLSQQTVYKRYKRIVNGMGIPDRSLHDLRHTFAVVSIENGDDIKTVQGNLGHSSASFTLDVYGHISDAMRSASSERMDNFLNDLRKDPDPTPPEEDTEKALLENEESSNIITFSSYFPNNIYTEQAK